MISSKNSKNTYMINFVILLIITNLYLFTQRSIYETQNVIFKYLTYILTIWVVFLCILKFSRYKFNVRSIINLLFILIMGAVSILVKAPTYFYTCVYSIFVIFLSEEQVVISYGISQIITIAIMTFLALFNGLSLWNNNVLALGYENPNTLGFSFFIIILALFLVKPRQFRSKYKLLLIIVSFFLEYYLIKDRTAAFLILVFVFLVFLKPIVEKNKWIQQCIVLLPIVLFSINFFLTVNLYKYEWIQKVDQYLSSRISLWNEYFTMYHLQLWPQNTNFYEINHTVGESLFVKNPFDGFLTLGILQYGVVLYLSMLLMLVLALYQSIKRKHYSFFVILVVLTLYSSSETIPALYYISYMLPTSFSIFLRKNNTERKYDRITKSTSFIINI